MPLGDFIGRGAKPAVRGPAFRRAGRVMLGLMPVLFLCFWHFGGPDVEEADARPAVIVNDPATDLQDGGFHRVSLAVEGNPEGQLSLAFVPEGASNSDVLHPGDRLMVLCEGTPCEVAEIQRGNRALIGNGPLSEFYRHQNRLTILGLFVWGLLALAFLSVAWRDHRELLQQEDASGGGRPSRRRRSSRAARGRGVTRG